MTLASDPHLDLDFALDCGLRAYVRAVSTAVGTGWESCSVDTGTPLSAYIALDTRLPGHLDCDVALLWHEDRGWSAVLETPSGEDLTLAHLGGSVVAEPRAVARFLTRLRAGEQLPPRTLVLTRTSAELAADLGPYVTEDV
ncbi:hypothetical protein FHX82_006379 [Amycolatopsis bartoniae]|uniref:DUF6292 domain-containing protein n=1 Tax=Amycolatopsis bartoniae TaxID=941986 RepID=A0A8H9INX3_9PSEU|nr:DUF6292 family protein [Amycolatopsis bartoniae]MBB2939293.1 hypothetical protein [Amycolatopsis bartoniae]TVT08748.1 hypothetical protein FNH07_11535 [Amycolatopsis bartoniae]GHF37522.1 hypothetical protein GCM10017566_08380 [Amycolatopsis bartoniae]